MWRFMMSVEWYDMIARKNGGYKSNAIFSVEGFSGETVFEERLINMLPSYNSVLDAGCGHGEFTLKMAKYARKIIGFDNSIELIKIANSLKGHYQPNNLEFVYATTRDKLPFEDGQFDLVYCRRGPTSILLHSRILQSGGTIFGIHSMDRERVKERLENNGFVDIEFEEYDQAVIRFPNEREFAKFLSASHGNPDYTLPENKAALDQLIATNTIDGKITLKEWRYIWRAKKS
jgi:SAM-dependent methyltransferase